MIYRRIFTLISHVASYVIFLIPYDNEKLTYTPNSTIESIDSVVTMEEKVIYTNNLTQQPSVY